MIMAIEITWGISNLERETEDGFVYNVHYTVDATDGTSYRSGAYGSLGLERPEEMIPYDSLTPEICIDWVKENLGEEKVAEVEAALVNVINEKKAPTKASGLPW